ncbi:MAG: AAA family ATPase [Lentisphaeria bacterium]|jgi:predicted AAA+ superfamily ATPase|nr:AAA family ATPase [Lentisphaeria bacterium]
MYRIAQEQIARWKDSRRRKPLIVRGARQVGKTWLVEHVAAAGFESMVKIDLEKRRDLHGVFGDNLDPRLVVQHLELDSGTRILPGRTLLFLDEIQACPRAIMALRYFHEQMPDLHVIAAGSLLEFALGEISVPVGRVQYLHLHPMTFREYLRGIGNGVAADLAGQHPSEVDERIQRKLLHELKTYFFVGGMPESVRAYQETGSLVESFRIQREILGCYREDFAKYSPRVDRDCLDGVLLNVARQTGEQVKYVRLDDGHTGPTNRRAFDLLCKARVVHRIAACNPSGLPLGASVNGKRFKAALLDIGLLQNLCQVPADLELREKDLLAMYRGKLAEQFVAQELVANHADELFYWAREARGSSAEVDYLAVREGRIVPVEVKSGAGGSLRSLHLMLDTYPNCPEGVVLHSGTYARLPEQRLTFLPLYYAGSVGDPRPDVA